MNNKIRWGKYVGKNYKNMLQLGNFTWLKNVNIYNAFPKNRFEKI